MLKDSSAGRQTLPPVVERLSGLWLGQSLAQVAIDPLNLGSFGGPPRRASSATPSKRNSINMQYNVAATAAPSQATVSMRSNRLKTPRHVQSLSFSRSLCESMDAMARSRR